MTWLEFTILLTLAVVGYLNDLGDVPFHVDETFWMDSSVRWDAWINWDLDHEVWKEGYDSYEVRPIPSYAVAISQRLAGISPQQNPSSFSELQAEYAQGANLRPADNILFFARMPMAVAAAAGIVLMSFFQAQQQSRLAGYLFFIFSFNAYFLAHLRRAMTESILILLTVLILMSTFQLLSVIQAKNTRKVVFWTATIGILGGLAGQSKLTGLGCLIVSLLAAHVTLLMEKRDNPAQTWKHFTIVSLVIPIVSLTTFIAVYPFFYTNTIERILNTVVYRVGVTRSQIEQFEWAVIAGGRLGTLFERVYIDLFPTLPRTLKMGLAAVVLMLSIAGIITVIQGFGRIRFTSLPGQNGVNKSSSYYLTLLLAALILAGPMLLTPLDWKRYFIYPVFFALVFTAIGLERILKSLYSRFDKKRIP